MAHQCDAGPSGPAERSCPGHWVAAASNPIQKPFEPDRPTIAKAMETADTACRVVLPYRHTGNHLSCCNLHAIPLALPHPLT